jgi:hypothetical protein
MKKSVVAVCITLTILLSGCSPKQDTAELKSFVSDQLRNSYDKKNWYVPLKIATEGRTAEQANWKDSAGNHSIGELVSHIIFWNERNLIAFQGNKLPDFSENNQMTFQAFTATNWEQALSKLDSIHSQLNDVIGNATPGQIDEWRSDIANISSHNAYHTGQIIYIRKLKGWWDASKGVQ